MHYEDLASDTGNCVKSLEEFSGLDLKGYEKKITTKKYHNLAGNPMRFKIFKGIKLDERWKMELPAHKRAYGRLVNYVGNLPSIFYDKKGFTHWDRN